jgi:hypothetical protein
VWGPLLLCWYGEGEICWGLALPPAGTELRVSTTRRRTKR